MVLSAETVDPQFLDRVKKYLAKDHGVPLEKSQQTARKIAFVAGFIFERRLARRSNDTTLKD